MYFIEGPGEENSDHATSNRESRSGCFRGLLSQIKRFPSCCPRPNVAKVCFHSSYALSSSSSDSCTHANAFRTAIVRDDLLTCFFFYQGSSWPFIFPHNLQDQNTPQYAFRSPTTFTSPHLTATRLIFLSVACYAKDPLFNIILTNLSMHNPLDLAISDRPVLLTTKTGYNVTRDRDVKISPDSLRVINNTPTPRLAPAHHLLKRPPYPIAIFICVFVSPCFSFLAFGLSCCPLFNCSR